jgi:UDP-glucuronate 4-epimerase
MEFITTLEKHLGMEAKKEFLPLQAGDVHRTFADVDELVSDVGFRPETSVDEGIKRFVDWYKWYNKIEP